MDEVKAPQPPDSGTVSAWSALGRVATGGAGLLLLAILAIYLAQEQSALVRYRTSGTYQSELSTAVNAAGDTVRYFLAVNPVDFPSGVFPQKGDTVLKIGDQSATPEYWRAVFHRVVPPDTQIVFTVEGSQGLHTYVMQTKLERRSSFFMLALTDALRFLIALGFVGVGLWAFFSQPNSTPVRVFAWFCFAMTSVMIAGVSIMPSYLATLRIPGFDQARQGLGLFAIGAAVFWLHLQFVFPRLLDFVRRNGKWIYPTIYAPFVIILAAGLLNVLNILDSESASLVANASAVMLLAWLLLGFGILFRRFRKTTDRIEKRQLRLILLGTAIGIGGFFVLVFILRLFGDWFAENSLRTLGMIVISFSLLLLTPLSYAYAFGRYRLLEVEGKVKRGTRYILATGVAFTILGGLVYLFVRYTFNDAGKTLGPIMLVALAFGVGRISSRLSKVIEKRFYPERRLLRATLESAIERSSALGSCREFMENFSDQVRLSLQIETVYPVLAGENGHGLRLRDTLPTPFLLTGEFLSALTRERRPVFVDEIMARGKTSVSPDEQEWLAGNKVAVVLPLMTQQRFAGFLALGFKTDSEDYTPEELSVLAMVAPQVAMASENLRLLEENVEKRRLEEQMQMARRIQEGFLPRELPPTLGLEIATHNRFSLEVAGDYFDVMPMPEGRTLVAIADVSGKGAGAALLMANLQASLRTAVEAGIALTQAITQVNNLIFRNTPPEQYITFVAVVFDPLHNELCFVNAGHNPPVLVRADGAIEELPPTGLILGAIQGVSYEKESRRFERGDTLVLYTDGVSEAMNSAEVEYGEDRIKELAQRLRGEPVAHVVTEIERDVELFCGRVPMEDDSTMVVVKRV